MLRPLEKFGQFIILALGFVIMAYLTLTKLVKTGYMVMETTEYIEFYNLSLVDWLVVLALLVIFGLIIWRLKKWSEGVIFALGAVIYSAIGTYLILGVEPIPRSDPRYVWEAALAINGGDYSTFSEAGLSSYLSIFPNQIGLVSIFRLFAQFSDDIRVIWFFQLALVIVNIFLVWGITKLLFNQPFISKLVLVISFLFLPSLLVILWAYGDILGLTGVLLTSYYLILFDKIASKNWLLPILACIMLMLAVLVRSNYAIFGLALISIYLLKFFKKMSWQPLVLIAMISVSLIAPNKLTQTYYQTVEHQAIPQGTPLKAWVVMGLGERAANPGYWDGYTTLLPVWHEFNQEEMTQRIDEDFSKRLDTLKMSWQSFFKKKIQVTWNEPTYQSVYVGPLKPREQEARTDMLKNFYEEGISYQLYHSYMTGLMLILFVGFTLGIIVLFTDYFKGHLDNPWHLLFIVFFIGGFLFHLVWETKSRYVYPFVILMLPYFAFGVYRLRVILKQLSDRSKLLKN